VSVKVKKEDKVKHFNSSRFITIGFVFLFLIVIISGVAFAEEGRNKIEITGDVFQAAGEEKPVLEADSVFKLYLQSYLSLLAIKGQC